MTNINCQETGATLEKLKNVILSHWEETVRKSVASSQNEYSLILLDHIPEILEQLIHILKDGEINEVELGKSHGFQRAILTDYSFQDLMNEFSILREVLMDYLYPMGNIKCAKIVHKHLDIIAKHSAMSFMNDHIMKNSLAREKIGNEASELNNNPIIEARFPQT